MNESQTEIHLHNGESLEDYTRQVQELFAEGDAYSAKNNSPKIAEVGEKLRALGQAHNDPVTDAWGILYGGMSHSILRRYDEALEVFGNALTKFEALGELKGIARTFMNFGRIHTFRGELYDAKMYYNQALTIEIKLENVPNLIRLLSNMAGLSTLLHNYQEIQDIRDSILPIIERSGNKSAHAALLSQAGLVAMVHLSQLPKALNYLEKALELCVEIGDKRGEATALDGIGSAYWYMGDAGRSIEYYARCIAIAEALDDPFKLAGHLTNAAYPYMLLGDYEKVAELNKQAKAIYVDTNTEWNAGWAEMGIGVAALKVGDPETAMEHQQRAIAHLEADKDYHGLGYAYFRCGEALNALEQYDEAYKMFNQSLELRRLNHAKLEIADTQCERGKLLIRLGAIDEAIDVLNEALQEAEAMSAKAQIFAVHRVLSDAYRILGDYTQAYRHLHEFVNVRDEIQNQESAKKAASVEYLHRQELSRKEQEATDTILNNILPTSITKRLKAGEIQIADTIDSVTVLFADVVGFTPLAAQLEAGDLVKLLAFIFHHFDEICKQHGLEKIKTIGDAYMAVAGAPDPVDDHALRCARAALAMLEDFEIPRDILQGNLHGIELDFRIGIHTGSAVAGVIGERKFAYDLWGDAVNTASRMESHGEAGKIHVSEDVMREVMASTHATFTERGTMEIKGKGMMKTYFLERVDG